MASSSRSIQASASVRTYSFITPIKLYKSNYLTWKSQVLASIEGNGLESYIDGSIEAPDLGRRALSPKYVSWNHTDKQLMDGYSHQCLRVFLVLLLVVKIPLKSGKLLRSFQVNRTKLELYS